MKANSSVLLRRLSRLAGLLLLGALLNQACADNPVQARQLSQVKSAFVINIAKFVAWPESSVKPHSAPLQFCFYRKSPLSEAFETFSQRLVNGRKISHKTVISLEQEQHCDILFLAARERPFFLLESHRLQRQPVLTILDTTDGASHEGIEDAIHVTLVRKGSKIGFDINLRAAEQSGLALSSSLLRLARVIRK